MTTPTKAEIHEKALELYQSRNWEISTNIPEIHELKEEGTWYEAQQSLMRSEGSEAFKYLQEMAQEGGYELVKQPKFCKFLKWEMSIKQEKRKPKKIKKKEPFLKPASPKKIANIIKMSPTIKISVPKILSPISPKTKKHKKKRQKLHVQRNGKTMRALKHIKGVMVFSFPDNIWKVRSPKKKGRRR